MKKSILAGVMAFVMILNVIPAVTVSANGGSFADAIDINNSFNTRITGNIVNGGQTVYYTFTAPVTGRYQFRTDGVTNEIRFMMYGANQAQIGFSSDNERLVELTEGTTYYLTARLTSGSATGAYSFIAVTPHTVDGKGGSFDTPIPALMDTVIEGRINVPGKIDYYIFDAPVTGRYQIRTDGISEQIRFNLYRANRERIGYSSDNERLVELVAGTTYYLTAEDTTSRGTGEHSFIIVTPHLYDGAYANRGGSFDTPVPILADTLIEGNINVPGKVDYYIFTAAETGTYSARTFGLSMPVRFNFYEANRSRIGFSADNERNVNLTAGVTYYFTAEGTSSTRTGEYSIVLKSPLNVPITRQEPQEPLFPLPELPHILELHPTPPAETVTPYQPGGSGSGFDDAITAPFDSIINATVNAGQTFYYAFAAPVTGRYQFKTEGVTLPVRFMIYNSDRTQIGFSSDNSLIATLTAGEVYYVTARLTSSSATGNYAITFITPVLFNGNGGSFRTPQTVDMNVVTNGKFNLPGKEDCFIFKAPVTGLYQIRTDDITNPIRFNIYRDNQTRIGFSSDNDFTINLTAGEIYYLTVAATTSTRIGDYSFVIVTPHTTDRRGGSFGTPINPYLNETVTGDINVRGKTDYYIFQVPTTGSYTIQSNGNMQLRFNLYSDNETRIGFSSDNTRTVTLSEGEIIYLTVEATTSSITGAYSFIVNAPNAKPVILGVISSHALESENYAPTIFCALEILKFIVGMPSQVIDAEGKIRRSAQISVGPDENPNIFCVLEILKYLVGMPSEANKAPEVL